MENLEINDINLTELSRLISSGVTSGRLDSEGDNGKGVYITWDLTMDKWQD
jgi:hypothetical protein